MVQVMESSLFWLALFGAVWTLVYLGVSAVVVFALWRMAERPVRRSRKADTPR